MRSKIFRIENHIFSVFSFSLLTDWLLLKWNLWSVSVCSCSSNCYSNSTCIIISTNQVATFCDLHGNMICVYLCWFHTLLQGGKIRDRVHEWHPPIRHGIPPLFLLCFQLLNVELFFKHGQVRQIWLPSFILVSQTEKNRQINM